ncbi:MULTISPECIES: hypothetical protein [unclassified Streptomyces]|uniref:hypothetical protein n=1 Tax=unclassified Streptomyces TaxID=2593676 RepID=UPI001660EB62|nr:MULTISPECIES: hypothetical protein [unclassified Streptomyces]
MSVRLTGDPGPGELAELTRRLTAAVAARLAQADRTLTHRHGLSPAHGHARTGEPYDPGRADGGGYALPSYADAGRPTRVPVRGAAPRPWTVRGTARARLPVEGFLAWIGEVLGHPLPQAVLYESATGTERWADVWLVEVDGPCAPEELGRELLTRAVGKEPGRRPDGRTEHKERTGSGERAERTEPAWALTSSAGALRRLHALDPRGSVAARVPGLPPRHVLFAFMALPRIDIADLAALGPGESFTLPVGDAGFCVDPERFQAGTGVPWERYVQEFGEEPVSVWIRPATVRPASGPARGPEGPRRDVLFLLLDRHAGGGSAPRDPTARLFVAEGDRFPGLPDAVRARAEWPPEPGVRVLYARAYPDLAPERLGAAVFRPVARRLAGLLLDRLRAGEDPGRALESLLDRAGPPRSHGGLGSLFTYVLEEFERAGRLGEVLDAADATGRFPLRLRLLQQCEATRYRTHPRVLRLREGLTREREATTAHAYVAGGPGQGEIRLDRDPGRTVKAGHVLAEADDVYARRVAGLRPKPGRVEALRVCLLQERHAMVRALMTGEDSRVYEPAEFAAEAMERAARAAALKPEDFDKVEVEHTLRVLDVLASEHDGLPSFAVRFEFVSRIAGENGRWNASAGPVVEPLGDFEARLVQWRLGRAGEVYRTIGLVVVGLGALAFAWEAGLVAVLLRLGGGARSVAWGVGLSWLFYGYKVVFGDEKFTVEGFLMAGVEGYLGSVGFRAGGGLGSAFAGRVGTQTARARLVGWATEKLVTGAVGGATTAGLDLFARDLVDVTLHGGPGSDTREYVRRMEIGAVLGIVMAFTVEPALRGAWRRLGPAAVKLALIARLLSREGVTAERWATATATGRQRMEQALGRTLNAGETRDWSEALGERIDEVTEQLAHEHPHPGTTEPAPPHAEAAPPRPGSAEPHPEPAPRWQSRRQLEEAAASDPEAGLDRAWYENASEARLRAREARDPVAREYLNERQGGAARRFRPDRPADPETQARLRDDLREARAAVEAERRGLETAGLRTPAERERAGWVWRDTPAGRQLVPPTAKGAAGYEGTVAVARSDIPALAGERFSGGSPRALGSYDPGHEIRPPENVVVPQAHGHAEQDLGQRLDARLARLTDAERAAARGRTVSIRVDQEVCSICAAGLGGGPRAGVLSRLSARHPDLVFEITADDTSTVYRLIAGRRVR